MYTLDNLLRKYIESPNDNAFRTWLQKEYDAGNITMQEIFCFMEQLAENLEELVEQMLREKNGEGEE